MSIFQFPLSQILLPKIWLYIAEDTVLREWMKIMKEKMDNGDQLTLIWE
jgi:hypothetical protein